MMEPHLSKYKNTAKTKRHSYDIMVSDGSLFMPMKKNIALIMFSMRLTDHWHKTNNLIIIILFYYC